MERWKISSWGSMARSSRCATLIFSLGLLFLSPLLQAAELSVEGTVDDTPAEIKRLAQRAAVLSDRIREMERRLSEANEKIVPAFEKESVEYRLELHNGMTSPEVPIAVSHIRISMDGQPFVYSQRALVVSQGRPLPLLLGRMKQGRYLLKIQLQGAPVENVMTEGAHAPWRTIDKLIVLDVNREAGERQFHKIQLVAHRENGGMELQWSGDGNNSGPLRSKMESR